MVEFIFITSNTNEKWTSLVVGSTS